MKLSTIIISAIVFIGILAHADLKSEFAQAEKTALSHIGEIPSQDGKPILESSASDTIPGRDDRVNEIAQKLQSDGLDTGGLRIEFAGLFADTEIFHAKSGNIICEVQYRFATEKVEKRVGFDCYDSVNPE